MRIDDDNIIILIMQLCVIYIDHLNEKYKSHREDKLWKMNKIDDRFEHFVFLYKLFGFSLLIP